MCALCGRRCAARRGKGRCRSDAGGSSAVAEKEEQSVNGGNPQRESGCFPTIAPPGTNPPITEEEKKNKQNKNNKKHPILMRNFTILNAPVRPRPLFPLFDRKTPKFKLSKETWSMNCGQEGSRQEKKPLPISHRVCTKSRGLFMGLDISSI